MKRALTIAVWGLNAVLIPVAGVMLVRFWRSYDEPPVVKSEYQEPEKPTFPKPPDLGPYREWVHAYPESYASGSFYTCVDNATAQATECTYPQNSYLEMKP